LTAEILESKTEYARALETNIHAFHLAITDKIKHEKNHDDPRKRVENLEKKEDVGSA